MSEFNIEVEGGSSVRLPTAGKYCDRDIVVTATGGGGYSEDDDVCFWDYDGTLLYSCTLAEAQAMTVLPEPPDHSQDDIPLTFEEWNWTLEEINALDRKADIGAIYSPTDGKTHFTLCLTKKIGLTVTVNFSYANGPLTFDWGDGTVEEHTLGGWQNSHSHIYSDYGIYHCSIDLKGKGWNPGGAKSLVTTELTSNGEAVTGKLVFDAFATWSWPNSQGIRMFKATVDTVIYPAKMTCGDDIMGVGDYVQHVNQPRVRNNTRDVAISGGRLTRRCSLPCNLTMASDYAFADKNNMREVRLPKTLVNFKRFGFCRNTSIKEVSLDGRNAIAMREFQECYSLKKIEVPVSVTVVDAEAFVNSGILDYYFYSETPPTLSNTSAFGGIKTNALIHVPAVALEDYKTATNWATVADYMVGDL